MPLIKQKQAVFKITNITVLIILVLIHSHPGVYAGGNLSGDFSLPEKTIESYYEYYKNKDIISNCFYPPDFKGSLEKFWKSYCIVSKKKTNKIGEITFSGVEISVDAVEIIVEVTMEHAQKGNPKTRFWYLVQKFNGEWKIIDHSHISDKNYPAYD